MGIQFHYIKSYLPIKLLKFPIVGVSGVPRGGLGCSNPPEIPKITVEFSIA